MTAAAAQDRGSLVSRTRGRRFPRRNAEAPRPGKPARSLGTPARTGACSPRGSAGPESTPSLGKVRPDSALDCVSAGHASNTGACAPDAGCVDLDSTSRAETVLRRQAGLRAARELLPYAPGLDVQCGDAVRQFWRCRHDRTWGTVHVERKRAVGKAANRSKAIHVSRETSPRNLPRTTALGGRLALRLCGIGHWIPKGLRANHCLSGDGGGRAPISLGGNETGRTRSWRPAQEHPLQPTGASATAFAVGNPSERAASEKAIPSPREECPKPNGRKRSAKRHVATLTLSTMSVLIIIRMILSKFITYFQIDRQCLCQSYASGHNEEYVSIFLMDLASRISAIFPSSSPLVEYVLVFMAPDPSQSSRGRGRYDRTLSASERARRARSVMENVVRSMLSQGRQLSVGDVIEEAGLGRNTFYSHFPDLETAVEEVTRQCAAEMSAALPSGVLDAAPYAAVTLFAQRWLSALGEHTEAALVCLRARDETLVERAGETIRALHGLGAAAGVFRRELSPERRRALVAVVIELSRAVCEGGATRGGAEEALVDGIVGLCR